MEFFFTQNGELDKNCPQLFQKLAEIRKISAGPLGQPDYGNTSAKTCNRSPDLQMSFEKIKSSKNVVAYNIVARKNTWSHQRRRRREQQKIHKLLGDPTEEVELDAEQNPEAETSTKCDCSTPDVESALNKLAEVRMSSPPGGAAKRESEDDVEEYYQSKRIKIAAGECKCHLNEFYLKALLVVRREGSEVGVELSWIEGVENREVLHQILQYIKNNLALPE